jgi:ribosome maturation factor RimP
VVRTNSLDAGEQSSPKRQAAEAVAARGPASASAVRELIEPTISGLGYELVDVQRAAQGLLRVTVDTLTPERAIGVDDCERISRQLSHLFAVEQVDYERLEVGSPGLDRPLVAARDFVRFAGSAIHVQLKEALQGRRRFKGRLLGLAGQPGAERALLELTAAGSAPAGSGGRAGRRRAAPAAAPPPPLELPLADIEKARLVPQFDFRGSLQAKQRNTKTGNEE